MDVTTKNLRRIRRRRHCFRHSRIVRAQVVSSSTALPLPLAYAARTPVVARDRGHVVAPRSDVARVRSGDRLYAFYFKTLL